MKKSEHCVELYHKIELLDTLREIAVQSKNTDLLVAVHEHLKHFTNEMKEVFGPDEKDIKEFETFLQVADQFKPKVKNKKNQLHIDRLNKHVNK